MKKWAERGEKEEEDGDKEWKEKRRRIGRGDG